MQNNNMATPAKKAALGRPKGGTGPTRYNKDMAKRLSYFIDSFISENQTEAAEKLNMSQTSLSLMINAKRSITFKLVEKLVLEYDLNNEWLVSGEGEKRSYAKDAPSAKASLQAVHTEVKNLNKMLAMMQANINHLFKRFEALEKQVGANEKEK